MKWPHPVEAEAHVTSEFNRQGVAYKNGSKNNIKFNCPFPHEKGQDTGFHMEITKDGRKVHCWVCDWRGSWNKLARDTGMTPFGSEILENTYSPLVVQSDPFGKLAQELDDAFISSGSESLPPENELSPWTEPVWRGLKNKFLQRIPSFLWKQPLKSKFGRTFEVERILWPYYQCDRLVGYVGRRLDKSDFQKYFRAPAPWCQAKNVLFPHDYVRDYFPSTDYIVLVEGEVDALNLLQAKIPALSILGSNNWSDHKRDLLLALGIRRAFLLMDPDQPGRKAAHEIQSKLVDYMEVKKIGLDPNDDPGSLDQGQLTWLKNHVSHVQT